MDLLTAGSTTDNPSPAKSGVCPICNLARTDNTPLCPRCGYIFIGTDYTLRVPVAPLPDDVVSLPTHRHLIHPKSIIFQIDNQILELPQRERLIIGRRGADSTLVQPDIDLTPFGAAEKGVSRQHTQLRTTAYLTYVADLNSKNGTWLNGLRILGDRLLRDGDELRLGQLTLTVQFC